MQTTQIDVSQLLTGTKVFVVPQFQRHYKWKMENWKSLFDDIVEQYELLEEDNGQNSLVEAPHFLGSIILHPAPNAGYSTVARYWIIDGQQRLTTLMALIAALRDVQSVFKNEYKERYHREWRPQQYTDVYLKNPYNEDSPYRLESGNADKQNFISTIYEGKSKGQIGRAYNWFYKKLETMYEDRNSPFDLSRFEKSLFNRLVLVEINTSSGDNINEIFNTINFSGVKLSSVDLIRNHSLMQFDVSESDEVYEKLWLPLEKSFESENDLTQYLWAQLVREFPKTRQRDLYAPFQRLLQKKRNGGSLSAADAMRQVLRRLNDEVDIYCAIIDSKKLDESEDVIWTPEIRQVVKDLINWNSKPRLPLMMEVLSRLRAGVINASDALRSLQYLMSYLVRRALCGVQTNSLSPTLTPIPARLKETGSGAISQHVAEALLRLGRWASDEEVLRMGMQTPAFVTMTNSQLVLLFSKREMDISTSSSDLLSENVARILPSPVPLGWQDYFVHNGINVELAKNRGDVLGDIAFGVDLPSDPDGALAKLKESKYIINNTLHKWTLDSIDARTKMLLKSFVSIWPRPDALFNEGGYGMDMIGDDRELPALSLSVSDALDALPADCWISLDDLARLCDANDGVDESEFISQIRDLHYRVEDFKVDGKCVQGVSGTVDDEDFDLSNYHHIGPRELVILFEKIAGRLDE